MMRVKRYSYYPKGTILTKIIGSGALAGKLFIEIDPPEDANGEWKDTVLWFKTLNDERTYHTSSNRYEGIIPAGKATKVLYAKS